MGYSYRRVGVNGKPRYAAIFCDQRGRRRSAGTFATKREADRAWAAAESDALLGVGRTGNGAGSASPPTSPAAG